MMRHPVTQIRRRRRVASEANEHQRGATIVEFAFMAPFLLILTLGIFEVGRAWETKQSVVQAARGGARTVTQLGTNDLADQQAILAITAAFGPDAGDIQRIVIYEADANGDWDPGCSTTAPSALDDCNVYLPVDIADAANAGRFDGDLGDPASCGPGAASSNWCPSSRDNVGSAVTYVGVFVEFEEEYITGFFGGGTYTMTERTVMRIEPEAS